MSADESALPWGGSELALSPPARGAAAALQILKSAAEPRGIPLSVRVAKRSIDVVFGSIGTLIAAILFPFIALAIYVESPGPIFYKQRRVRSLSHRDEHGRCVFRMFDMLKFRTMKPDAEKLTGVTLAEENDPRVTRVGRLLRRTRLDELPQIWHVLNGDMSLVGPRPERPELLENLSLAIPFFEERMHDAKPGITGFAQISLGYAGRPLPGTAVAELQPSLVNPYGIDGASGSLADDMRTKLLFDLAYVVALESFRTFVQMEAAVILKTPWVMLRGLGR